MVIEARDGTLLGLCRDGSNLNTYGSPLFADDEGPTAKTEEGAAEEFVAEVKRDASPSNPELARLPRGKAREVSAWLAASFQPARSLAAPHRISGPTSTRFTRHLDGNPQHVDVLIEVERHENGHFFVAEAHICGDALNDRDAVARQPTFMKEVGELSPVSHQTIDWEGSLPS